MGWLKGCPILLYLMYNNLFAMEEIWKDIPGYEGLYQVSNLGRVKSFDRYVEYDNGRGIHYHKGRFIKPSISPGGYRIIGLYKEKVRRSAKVSRLVAEAFIPNPDNLPIVNHKDENKTNDTVENLEWCDIKYNTNYGTGIERMVNTKYHNGVYKHMDLKGLRTSNINLYRKILREKSRDK